MHHTDLVIKVTSPAFKEGENIPSLYTCDGKNINPPLHIDGLPEGTKSLALIVDDPDAPHGTWVHWVVWNIPPTNDIRENTVPGQQGLNDFQRTTYGGPCPPSGTHRYFFKVYALDQLLTLPPRATKNELESAMKNHILSNGQIMGRYARK